MNTTPWAAGLLRAARRGFGSCYWLLALLFLGIQTRTSAAVQTETYTVAIQFTDWTNTVTFPQFNPASGTLVGVRFELTTTARSISRVENLDAVPRAGVISGAAVDAVAKDLGASVLVSSTTHVKFTNNLAAYDGLSDYAGSSGISNPRRAATLTVNNTVLPPFAAYEGAGNFDVVVAAKGNGFCIGPVNYLLQIRPELGVTLSVHYDYEIATTPTTIGDLVWNDYNANGVWEPGEPGLPGVTVTLLDAFGAPVPGVLPTTTDADGFYSFVEVPAGTYYVVVEPPVGFVATYDLDDVDLSNSALVTVASGDTKLDADFGFAQLTSSLGDRVWVDADGNGVQDVGEVGLEGVTVHLFDGGGIEVASAVVDINGTYGFTGLTAGTYTLTVTGLPAGYAATFDADGIGTPDSAVVTIGAGEFIDWVDFGYQPRNGSIGDLVWQDRDADGAVDLGEPGLAGVTVELRSAADFSVLATTATDSAGAYAFTGLGAGAYVVVVQPPAGFQQTHDADGVGTADQTAVTLAADEVRNDVDFGYQGGRLGDRVWNDADGDGVQDVGETGLAGATVTLSTGATTTTDSDGYYSFGDLAAGTYTVTVTVPSGWVATYDADGTGTPGASSATVAAGAIVDTIDFGYQEQTAIVGDRVWRDDNGDGVQDSGEVGLSGVVVELRNADGTTVLATATTDANGFYQFANLSAGTYVVTAVQPASHVPTFDADGITVPNQASVVLAAGQARNDVDFGYQPLGSIGDLVWLDLDDNGSQMTGVEPGLSGVVVTATGTGGTFTTTTDADGYYLFNSLPPGTYTIAVTPIPGLESTHDFDGIGTADLAVVVLGPGENKLTVDFGYNIGSNLSDAQVGDRVWLDVDADGQQDSGEPGLAGLSVQLRDGANVLIGTQTTGSNGEYLFTGLPAGTYTATVLGAGALIPTYDTDGVLSVGTATVTLANGEQRRDVDFGYRVPPPQPANIGGRVWDDANSDTVPSVGETGLSGLVVTLRNSGGVVVGTQNTDASGFYAFTAIPAGSYSVAVTPAAYWGPTYDIDGVGTANTCSLAVAAGENRTNVNFGYLFAPPPGSIGDRVWHDLDGDGVEESGEPGLAGVTVQLRDSVGTVIASIATDAGGYYGFTDVGAGDYSVTILAPTYHDATGDLDGPGTPNSASFSLGAGQELDSVDFGLLYNPPPALIGDRVWDDANSNGVQDSGEAGLGGLTVTLADTNGVVVSTATTDGAGAYEFTGIEAGTYTVTVTPPTYYIPTHDLDGIATTNVVTLSVAIGQTNRLVDFGLVYAPPLGSIGNRVWIDGNMNGVQDSGELGMTNIAVTLRNGVGAIHATTTTDSSGEYRFTGLSAQTYTVEVTVPTNAIPTADPDATAPATSAVVPLAIGEHREDVDFGFYIPAAPAVGRIGDRVWIDADEDGVQDSGEAGLTNAVVTLRDSGGVVVATATADDNGAYEFTGLEAGTYTVTVAAPSDYEPTYDVDSHTITPNAAEVILGSGENRVDADFGYVYNPPDPLTGRLGDRVWADVNGNGLVDGTEAGLTNVVVELLGGGGAVLQVATTGSNGEYLFENLASGTYSVRVMPPVGYVATSDLDGVATLNIATVTIAAAEERLDVDFGYLPPAPATIGNRVWVDANSNGIQDAAEVGLTNIVVVLKSAIGVPISTNVTGANGGYTFGNLAAGTYKVTVLPPVNYGPTWDLDGTGTPNEAAVTVVYGQQQLDVDFGYVFCPGTGRIGDLVWVDTNADGIRNTSGSGESGLPNATVTLSDANGYVVATQITDSNGRYEFVNLLGGSYTVVVTPPSGYTQTYDLDGLLTPHTTSVTLAVGQTRTDVDFGYTRYTPRHTTGTGCTPGFWGNRNGQSLLRPYDFAVLTSLSLVNDNGSARDFTASLDANKSALDSWLASGTAVSMSRMLSVHLACFQLNVLHGFYDASDVIPTPGVGSGSMTASALIAAANAALTTDGYTPTGDPNRAYQELLKNALDAANQSATR